MKYYISHLQKKDFYLLGTLTPTGFIEGHGIKFIKAYLDEFPFLMDEISVTDESKKVITLSEFFNKIKN